MHGRLWVEERKSKALPGDTAKVICDSEKA